MMRLNGTKLLAMVAISSMLATSFFLFYHVPVAAEETASGTPLIRAIDSLTGLDNLTFGGTAEPMPPGGYKFTVNVTLENIDHLYDYEVAIEYNTLLVNCTGAKINKLDPTYVFYQIPGGSILVPTYFNTNPSYVAIGASALTSTASVSSPRLLCQLDFVAQKVGTSSLDFIVEPPTIFDQSTFVQTLLPGGSEAHDAVFSAQNLSVTVNPVPPSPPIASFTFSPDNPKPGQNVTFDASASISPGGNIIDYSWDFADNTTLSTANSSILHMFPVSGAYNVSLTVSDDTGSGMNGTVWSLILLGSPPIVNFTFEPSEPKPFPDVVTFNASLSYDKDGSIVLYLWDFGDNTTANSTDGIATNIYVLDGGFNVTLTIYDNDGLFNSTVQTIFVGYRPVADFFWTPELPTQNDTITFNGQSSRRGNPNDDREQALIQYYVWDFGDLVGEANGTFLNASVTEYSYRYIPGGTGGNYSVTLTVYDGFGLYGSTTQIVEVSDIGGVTVQKSNTIYWIVLGVAVVAILVVAIVLKRRQKPELARKERFRVV
jgi:hypothetical protein